MPTYYTPLADGEAVSANTFNTRFEQLDSAIGSIVNSTVLVKPWVTLTGSIATISITGIPTGYKAIQMVAIWRTDRAGLNYTPIAFNVNSDATLTNYVNLYVAQDAATTLGNVNNSGLWSVQNAATAALSTADYFSAFDMTIYDYAETTIKLMMGRVYTPSDTITPRLAHFGGHYIGASAINRMDFIVDGGGNFITGTKYAVYGIK